MQCENYDSEERDVSEITIEDAKAYMNRAFELDQKIKVKKEQALKYKDIALNISPNLSDMPKSPSPTLSPMENAMARVVDLEGTVKKCEQELLMVRMELLDIITKIENCTAQELLMKRHLEYKSWAEINGTMCYTKRYLYKLYRTALDEVRKIMPR